MGNDPKLSVRGPVHRLVRGFKAVCMGLGAVWLAVTATPWICDSGARWLAGPWREPDGKTLVVLGGSQLGGEFIGLDSFWRCVYAARAYRAGHYERVIVSGGGRERAVSEQMREFLIVYGVPGDRIVVETKSQSTRENAVFMSRLLGAEKDGVVLLTSDYHMLRARRAFAAVGVAVSPYPFPDVVKRAGSWRTRWPAFLDLVTEAGKTAYYWAKGWL